MFPVCARLLLGLLIFSEARASFSPAVSFFRSPQSLFPSGQAAPADLEKGKKGEVTVNFYQVKKDQRDLRLDAAVIDRDLDLCLRAVDTKTGQTGTLTKFAPPWYEFADEKGLKAWKLADQLAPLPDDLGLASVFASHPFRKSPDWKSESHFDLKAGTKFRVLGFKDEFVKAESLETPGQIGYLELSHVILKIDFASFVMEKSGAWKEFSYREDKNAILANRDQIRLDKIQGVITRPELGIANQLLSEAKLVPRSTVQILRGEWVQWAESELKGHGRVFWKKEERLSGTRAGPELFTTDEILAKSLYSVATHPKNAEQALVSGEGVFWTPDGKSWVKFPNFQSLSLPVAIGDKGELFVGGFRSVDQGKTFQPFLRWEDLTSLLETRHNKTPGVLKISEIKSMGPEKVQITVETGASKSWLVGSSKFGLITDWKILREK